MFNKKDLKPGMLCVCCDGRHLIVMPGRCGCMYMAALNDFCIFDYLDDNLVCHEEPYYTVNEIYDVASQNALVDLMNKSGRKLLWRRSLTDEIKEVTIKDIEQKFGCKVKIVG